VPKLLIDERWNVSRRDVSFRTAGVVFIQLVRGTTFPGASFPGTMISRVRRAPRLPRLAPRPSRAGSASAPSRPPRPPAPPPSPRSAPPHCSASHDFLPYAQLSASGPPLPPVPVTPTQVPPIPLPPSFYPLCPPAPRRPTPT
jgi:hypothetical protein